MEKLYVRKATGLVRQFSTTDMLIANLFSISWGLSMLVEPVEANGLYPGLNFNYVLAFVALFLIPTCWIWAMLTIAMPRSAGIHVIGSSIIHPALGFVVSFAWMIYAFYAIGLFCNWTVTIAIPTALATFGYVSNVPSLVQVANTFGSKTNILLVGTLLIVVVSGLVCFPKILKGVLIGAFAIAVVGSVVALGALIFSSPSGFVEVFNKFVASTTGRPDGYNYTLTKATELGNTIPAFSWAALVGAIPYGYFMYIGFYYSGVYLAGEVKQPTKSLPFSILGSLVLSWVFYTLCVVFFYQVVGWNMTHALAFLYYNHPEAYPLPYDPYFNLITGILAGNALANGLIAISTVLWLMFVTVVVMMGLPRLIFTWSFYRIAPEQLAKVSSKYHSPWVAVAVAGVGSWLFLVLNVYGISSIISFTIMNAAIFLLIGICALVFPFRKKELFEASPSIVKKRIFGFPLISLAAIVHLIFYSIIFYASFSLKFKTWSFLLLAFVPGIVIYYVARAFRRRQGIDLDFAFKELPPE